MSCISQWHLNTQFGASSQRRWSTTARRSRLANKSTSRIYGRPTPAKLQSAQPAQLSVRSLPCRQDRKIRICATTTLTRSRAFILSTLNISGTSTEIEENVDKVEDYEKLAKDLEKASPLEIMDKSLEKFGTEVANAFSGAEDVALIEHAKLTGRPFRVFSLDTGRLNPETYNFFESVEKHYGIRIEYMFPDTVEEPGLFSFHEDGHQECCRVQ